MRLGIKAVRLPPRERTPAEIAHSHAMQKPRLPSTSALEILPVSDSEEEIKEEEEGRREEEGREEEEVEEEDKFEVIQEEDKVEEIQDEGVKVTPTPLRCRPTRPRRFLLPAPGWVLLKGEKLEMPPELDRQQMEALHAKIPPLQKREVKTEVEQRDVKDNVMEESKNWSEKEEEIFVEKFLETQKEGEMKSFRKIANFLEGKSTGDCIKFYYVNKKEVFKKKGRKYVKK
jgi:hypothetical protein